MAEPERDHGCLDTGFDELHCCAVAQRVGCHVAGGPCRAIEAGGGDVAVDEIANGVGVEWSASSGWEQRILTGGAEFSDPRSQDGDGVTGEWCASFFASFAVAGDVGAGTENDVLVA